jgi:hypothetical protein
VVSPNAGDGAKHRMLSCLTQIRGIQSRTGCRVLGGSDCVRKFLSFIIPGRRLRRRASSQYGLLGK